MQRFAIQLGNSRICIWRGRAAGDNDGRRGRCSVMRFDDVRATLLAGSSGTLHSEDGLVKLLLHLGRTDKVNGRVPNSS